MSAIFFEKFRDFFLEQGKLFFFSFYLHLIINFFIIRFHQDKFNKRFFEKIISAFFFLISINLFLIIFSLKFLYIIYFLLFLTIVLSVIEINLYIEYQIFLTSDIFILLFETNSNETKEFLDNTLSLSLLKNIFLVSGILILFPFLFAKYSYNFFNNILKDVVQYNIIQYALIGFFLFIIVYFLQAQKKKKRRRYYDYLPIFRIFREYLIARDLNKKNLAALGLQKNIEKEILDLTSKNKEIDNFIFIIGESASRNYMEIYNSYASDLKNSPNMIRREKNGEVFVFDDIISQNSITSLVIPPLLTFKNYENEKEWYDYKNIISILKKAGYTTYWLSNQAKNETIAKVFSSLADKKFFSEDFIENNLKEKNNTSELFKMEGTKKVAYDNILVEEGFKILENEKKKAIFIHLQGSHLHYSNRYPKKWEIDKISNIKRELPERRKKYIAEYSNSLRYTDYVLERIFSYFSNEKSFFIYLSDHAEEFWEERDLRGHTSENGSKYMIEIPFFIMMSKKLQEIYPNLVEACKKSLHKPYMTDDIIHTVLGILGIEIDEYEGARDLLSDKFNEKRKRMYQGKDYDTFWKKQFDKK